MIRNIPIYVCFSNTSWGGEGRGGEGAGRALTCNKPLNLVLQPLETTFDFYLTFVGVLINILFFWGGGGGGGYWGLWGGGGVNVRLGKIGQ